MCNLLEHILDNNQNTRYNINEILNHRYFASQYNLYTLDTYQPINLAFYNKTSLPLTAVEWKNLVKKFVNNDTLCGTIHTNSTEIKSKPKKKAYLQSIIKIIKPKILVLITEYMIHLNIVII